MPPAFEGGQTPLWKRVPKRGFKNPHRRNYAFVNVGQLNEHFTDGAEITPQALEEQGIIKKLLSGVKVLGDGPLAKKLVVKAHKFSKSAREKILAAGGQAVALMPTIEETAMDSPAVPQEKKQEKERETPQEQAETKAVKPKKKVPEAQQAKEAQASTKKTPKQKTPKKSEGKGKTGK
jgi:ribosomal protein L18E